MQKKIFLPLLSAVSTATAAALVTNGGFETGAASPWVIGGGGSAHVASNSDSAPFLVAAHSGTHFLWVLSFLFRDPSTISREKADEPLASSPTTASQPPPPSPRNRWMDASPRLAVGITFVASATLFASTSGNGITVAPYFALNGTYVAPAGSTGRQSLVVSLGCGGEGLGGLFGLDDVTLES
ncbi:hypothetical protein B0H13DRAFT_2313615 [Mycena leptocephala]|nr:hypothetical protein B0H13DRAFT_2313615 [Mycena leptocephala]